MLVGSGSWTACSDYINLNAKRLNNQFAQLHCYGSDEAATNELLPPGAHRRRLPRFVGRFDRPIKSGGKDVPEILSELRLRLANTVSGELL